MNSASTAESGQWKAESGKRKAESGKRKAESGKRKAKAGLLVLALPAFVALVALAGPVGGAEPDAVPAQAKPRVKLSDLFGDEVVARGKGVEVKRSRLEQALTTVRAKLAARGQSIPEDRRAAHEAQMLQRIIRVQILTNRATAADHKVAEEAVEKKIKEAREHAVSEEAFQRQFNAAGLTFETYRRVVAEESLAEAVLQRELAGDVKVTDEEVKDLYYKGIDLLARLMEQDFQKVASDPNSAPEKVAKMKEDVENVRKANLAPLEQPERVRVSHIFMITRDRKTDEPLSEEQKKFKRLQLERIRKRALDGEDFTKLVMEYSEDRGLKETKGEYTFSRADPFAPELKSAAFSLQPGKISDVVTTAMGMHVVKLLERIPAKKVEFEKVAKDLKEFITQQHVQRAMPEFFARLSKEAGVELLDPKYRLVSATDLDVAPQTR